MQVLSVILGITSVVMFIIMFVVVIKIWNLQKEILDSGGYPTVSYARSKRDAGEILAGRAPWDYDINQVIQILSRYPDDPEAAELMRRLAARNSEAAKQ